MKTWLLLVLVGSCLNLFAQELDQLDYDESYVYRQSGYQLNDPKGDALLLWSTHDLLFNQIPAYTKENFSGKAGKTAAELAKKIEAAYIKFPQYVPVSETKNILIEDYVPFDINDEPIALEGEKAPIQKNNFLLMLKQVISEEFKNSNIEPKAGTIHTWSPEIRAQLKKRYKGLSHLNKLLVVLSRGASSRFIATGTEENLVDYILSRPINSINLEEMFRASYRINDGDVYLTFLTVENVLSRFWITPQREKRAVTTRLKDITNYNYSTDKFGAWYHFFGMLVYGHAYGAGNSKFVAFVEALSDKMMTGFKKDPQEDKINYIGGKIGSQLRKFIDKKEYLSFEQDTAYLREDFYMDLTEDFSKRLTRIKEKTAKKNSKKD